MYPCDFCFYKAFFETESVKTVKLLSSYVLLECAVVYMCMLISLSVAKYLTKPACFSSVSHAASIECIDHSSLGVACVIILM